MEYGQAADAYQLSFTHPVLLLCWRAKNGGRTSERSSSSSKGWPKPSSAIQATMAPGDLNVLVPHHIHTQQHMRCWLATAAQQLAVTQHRGPGQHGADCRPPPEESQQNPRQVLEPASSAAPPPPPRPSTVSSRHERSKGHCAQSYPVVLNEPPTVTVFNSIDVPGTRTRPEHEREETLQPHLHTCPVHGRAR